MARTFTIVVPVFQNEANLHETIPKLLSLQEQLPSYHLELVFVDDGSRDHSLKILIDYVEKYPKAIKVIKLTRNFGQTPAIQAGLRHTHSDCVGIISADLQEPYELFVDMIKEWECGAKFVIGAREVRREGRLHQMVSNIYWSLTRRFAFPDFPKLGYDFCLLDRQVVEDINHINEKNSSIFVLIYWLGYQPTHLPVTRKLRNKGRSQWDFWKKISITLDTLIGFTYLPARFITGLSFTLAFLCVIYFILMFILWFWYKAAPPGWLTVIGLLAILGAIILFSIGILSEYLLRILDEARKRPPYVVDYLIDQTDEKNQASSS